MIGAALRRYKTTRAAARALKLSNHMQLVRMLDGSIRDTPQMKMALARANARAKRAWSLIKLEEADCIDPAQIKPIVGELSRVLEVLRALAPNGNADKPAP